MAPPSLDEPSVKPSSKSTSADNIEDSTEIDTGSFSSTEIMHSPDTTLLFSSPIPLPSRIAVSVPESPAPRPSSPVSFFQSPLPYLPRTPVLCNIPTVPFTLMPGPSGHRVLTGVDPHTPAGTMMRGGDGELAITTAGAETQMAMTSLSNCAHSTSSSSSSIRSASPASIRSSIAIVPKSRFRTASSSTISAFSSASARVPLRSRTARTAACRKLRIVPWLLAPTLFSTGKQEAKDASSAFDDASSSWRDLISITYTLIVSSGEAEES